jgi:hypothetical protein
MAGSWVPNDRYRAQISSNQRYVQIVIEGRIFSVQVDLMFELIAGHRESLRLSEYHREESA